jgi:hypothetical protein
MEEQNQGGNTVPTTKDEMLTAAKSLPPTDVFSMKPRTFEEAYRFANFIASSSMIPREFQNNPANVLIAIQLGMELGVPPMQALQNIAVINGRPAIWGDLIPAIVYQSKLCEQFDEIGNDKEATCTVKRKGMPPIKRTFTWEDAKRAGLADKDTYKKFPARMLQMRARGYAVRDAFADVLKGVHLREELEDLEPRDVTPIATPKALAAQPKGYSGVEDARQPLAKEKEPEKKADENKPSLSDVRSDSGLGKRDQANVANLDANIPADSPKKKTRAEPTKAPETQPEAKAEKSQEEIIAECLLWIESAPEDQINAEKDNWLLAQLPRLKGTANQMAVLRPFNDRRHGLKA